MGPARAGLSPSSAFHLGAQFAQVYMVKRGFHFIKCFEYRMFEAGLSRLCTSLVFELCQTEGPRRLASTICPLINDKKKLRYYDNVFFFFLVPKVPLTSLSRRQCNLYKAKLAS